MCLTHLPTNEAPPITSPHFIAFGIPTGIDMPRHGPGLYFCGYFALVTGWQGISSWLERILLSNLFRSGGIEHLLGLLPINHKLDHQLRMPLLPMPVHLLPTPLKLTALNGTFKPLATFPRLPPLLTLQFIHLSLQFVLADQCQRVLPAVWAPLSQLRQMTKTQHFVAARAADGVGGVFQADYAVELAAALWDYYCVHYYYLYVCDLPQVDMGVTWELWDQLDFGGVVWEYEKNSVASSPTTYNKMQPDSHREVDEIYPHQIKARRIKKQLHALSSQHYPFTTISPAKPSPIGLHIPITYQRKHKPHHFQLRLDLEYPFSHPQLHSLDRYNNLISEARDLLYLYFEEGQMWGPSMMLSKFVEGMGLVMDRIEEHGPSLVGVYWPGEVYDRQELEEKGLRIYQVRQNQWGLIMKSTKPKVIAVSSNVLLLFEPTTPQKLLLQSVTFIKDIREITTNIPQHQVTFKGQTDSAIYLVIEKIEQVLEFINPIQMVERRVQLFEDGREKYTVEQLMRDYGFLIEYYSVRDEDKSMRYLKEMKNVIKENYATTATSAMSGQGSLGGSTVALAGSVTVSMVVVPPPMVPIPPPIVPLEQPQGQLPPAIPKPQQQQHQIDIQ